MPKFTNYLDKLIIDGEQMKPRSTYDKWLRQQIDILFDFMGWDLSNESIDYVRIHGINFQFTLFTQEGSDKSTVATISKCNCTFKIRTAAIDSLIGDLNPDYYEIIPSSRGYSFVMVELK